MGDTDRTEAAIRSSSGPGVVEGTAAIARRANRVVQVAELEASNSADGGYVDQVNNAVIQLKSSAFHFPFTVLHLYLPTYCKIC